MSVDKGPEAKRDDEMDHVENQQHLAKSGRITGSSDKIELSSSDQVGKAASKGKEDSAEFIGSTFPALLGSPICLYSIFHDAIHFQLMMSL